MEGKLEGVCIATKSGREFYSGYSELVVAMSVSVKIDGLWNVLEQLTLLTLTAFRHLKSC